MATCKDCLHNEVCSGYLPTDLDKDVFYLCAKGRSDEISDIEERCSSFKDRSKYVVREKCKWILNRNGSATCKKCLHTTLDAWDIDKWLNFCPHCGADMRERRTKDGI